MARHAEGLTLNSHNPADRFAAGPDALGISDSAFTLLRDLIEQHLGVYYDENKRDLLVDRLSQITSTHGMQSFLDYYYMLKYDDNADQYWSELSDHLAVPETFFWRQPEHFEALVQHIVPEHTATRRGQALRIWSAACCTGEEPLSIAMALKDSGAFDRMRIEIIASDASPAMVARARKGTFGERSFRNLPEDMRARHFRQVGNAWKVNDDLLSRIDWRVINLVDEEETMTVGRTDVVFCRNVMIYFSDDAIRRVADMLARQIRAGGRLFLGAAESLTRFNSSFMLSDMGRALVYTNYRTDRSSAMLGF